MRSIYSFTLLFFLFARLCLAQNANDMKIAEIREGWQFRQSNIGNWMPASVPGSIHTALMANDIIEDPFYRVNEKSLQWIDKNNWEYRTTFQAGPEWLRHDRITLEFLGLDTYADVYLNGTLILQADNFHRAWEADVKGTVKEGDNELYIYLHSPTQVGLKKLEALGYGLPASNDQSENGGMGDKRVSIFVRKPGYHFGWDWGPRLVPSGIWRPVHLKAWNDARVSDVYFHQESVTEAAAKVDVRIELEAEQALNGQLSILWKDSLLASRPVQLEKGQQQVTVPLTLQNPQLWWTKELGDPFLYEMKVVLERDGREVARHEERIGLRSIRIVQEPDAKGTSFYLELNGRPLFSKGANYIPNDVFLERVDTNWYREMIQSAADANMNMLRIWGGGIYEDGLFYDLCDEMGILVWQDFMFACSMYPWDSAFLESVRQEAVYNIRRLRNHPSIALWCGNNEIDVAWAQYNEKGGWGWKQQYTSEQRADIWAGYEKVFHELLPQAVETYHPGAFYWPSSPYAGEGTHASYSTTSGDIHYWGVWHGEHPFSDFRNYIGRFMSEYGFQSFPEFRTVEQYTLPQDWDIESEVMAAHQRSGIGNLRIRSYMEDDYILPENFSHFLYVGQLLQAESIKMAIESHRSAKPFCMGTLYWQLNDCWPVASWSGIDYYRRWKALHYFVRDAFKTDVVVLEKNKDDIKVYTCSGRKEPVEAELRLELRNFEGELLWYENKEVQLSPDSARLATSLSAAAMEKLGDKKQLYLRGRLLENGRLTHENLLYFVPPKELSLPPNPGIEAEVKTTGIGQYELRLKASKLAKNVFLQFEESEGFFSDNYFDLQPGEEKVLTFRESKMGERPLTVEELSMISLVDTY
ncbi:MAG: glycoside hydrolase family 2 protein [Phaeodactylibacter sp.]|nr:glycoside hydrolase family 2 protein [Phaeodactylibacter sp.]MCB9052263.1 glycoside hydrolase family 2 protein [Lewinellaceae bacterium]